MDGEWKASSRPLPARYIISIMGRDAEVVVVGSGLNGLVAACQLARHGLSVVVLEADSTRPGVELATAPHSLPGVLQDRGSSWFFGLPKSPALNGLELYKQGIEWHPARCAHLHLGEDHNSVALRAADSADESDPNLVGTPEYEALQRWCRTQLPSLLSRQWISQLAPTGLKLGNPLHWMRSRSLQSTSPDQLGRRWFRSALGQRVVSDLALSLGLPPDKPMGPGAISLLLLLCESPELPRGGAQQISNGLLRTLEGFGGHLRLNAAPRKILSPHRLALESGEEISFSRAMIVDTPERVSLGNNIAAFRVDWVLNSPIPWDTPGAQYAARVYLSHSSASLRDFAHRLGAGQSPSLPAFWIEQPSQHDSSRAPGEQHLASAFTWVALSVTQDPHASELQADRMASVLNAYAPGFARRVIDRTVQMGTQSNGQRSWFTPPESPTVVFCRHQNDSAHAWGMAGARAAHAVLQLPPSQPA